MRRTLLLLATLFLSIFLSACTKETVEETYDIKIYAMNNDETELTYHGYNFGSSEAATRIEEVWTQLRISDEGGEYFAALSKGAPLMNWTLSEKGILTCYFGSEYHSMKSTVEILSRAAIVKTFCQLPEVFGVEFIVGEEALSINNSVVGIMTDELFLMDVGLSGTQMDVVLFYCAADKSGLIGQEYTLYADDSHTIEWLVVEALIDGPEGDNVLQTVPPGTKVNRVTTKDSICYVDLSKEFMEYLVDVPPELTIYSIVNSLCDLGNVNSVVITIDGETPSKYLTVDISTILERNLDYVQSTGEEE